MRYGRTIASSRLLRHQGHSNRSVVNSGPTDKSIANCSPLTNRKTFLVRTGIRIFDLCHELVAPKPCKLPGAGMHSNKHNGHRLFQSLWIQVWRLSRTKGSDGYIVRRVNPRALAVIGLEPRVLQITSPVFSG